MLCVTLHLVLRMKNPTLCINLLLLQKVVTVARGIVVYRYGVQSSREAFPFFFFPFFGKARDISVALWAPIYLYVVNKVLSSSQGAACLHPSALEKAKTIEKSLCPYKIYFYFCKHIDIKLIQQSLCKYEHLAVSHSFEIDNLVNLSLHHSCFFRKLQEPSTDLFGLVKFLCLSIT